MWHARLLSVGTGLPTVGIINKLPLFGVTGFAGFCTLFYVTEGVYENHIIYWLLANVENVIQILFSVLHI